MFSTSWFLIQNTQRCSSCHRKCPCPVRFLASIIYYRPQQLLNNYPQCVASVPSHSIFEHMLDGPLIGFVVFWFKYKNAQMSSRSKPNIKNNFLESSTTIFQEVELQKHSIKPSCFRWCRSDICICISVTRCWQRRVKHNPVAWHHVHKYDFLIFHTMKCQALYMIRFPTLVNITCDRRL